MLPGPNLRKRGSNRNYGSAMDFPVPEAILSVFTVFLICSLCASWFVAPELPCISAFSKPPSISPDEKDLSAVDGQIVHVEGPLYEVRLEDHEFFFSRRGVKLERVVEMFQWTKRNDNKGNVEYVREWRAELIDSSSHPSGHLNPRAMPFNNHTQMSLPVRLGYSGRLELDQQLNSQLPVPVFSPVETADMQRLQRPLQGTVKAVRGYLFRGRDIRMPSVGDVRVSFWITNALQVTAIARLRGRRLERCNSLTEAILEEGSRSVSEMRAGHGGVWRRVLQWLCVLALIATAAAWALRWQSSGKKKE